MNREELVEKVADAISEEVANPLIRKIIARAAITLTLDEAVRVAEGFARPTGWEDFADGQGCASEAIAAAIKALRP